MAPTQRIRSRPRTLPSGVALSVSVVFPCSSLPGHAWPSRKYLRRHLFEFREGCIAQGGREPDDHPTGASLCEPLQRVSITGLAKDCDIYGTGITSGCRGERIQGGAAHLDLL